MSPRYELLQGGKAVSSLKPNTLLIREKRPNHFEKRNVIYADGSLELLDRDYEK